MSTQPVVSLALLSFIMLWEAIPRSRRLFQDRGCIHPDQSHHKTGMWQRP